MPTPTKTPSPTQNAPSPRQHKLFKCRQTSCPGLGTPPDLECIMCDVCLHSFCVTEANREIEAAGAEAIEEDNLCLVACYFFCKADSLTPKVIKVERALLMKKRQGAAEKGRQRIKHQGEMPRQRCQL